MAEAPRLPRRSASGSAGDWRRRARQPRAPRSQSQIAPSDYDAPPPPARHPVYGGQARRQDNTAAYALGILVVIGVLVVFLFLGIQWATGAGRTTGLGSIVTPTVPSLSLSPSPILAVGPSPSPSPSAGPPTYVVQAGDTPGSIAAKLGVSVSALETANHITNPSDLQIGQTLFVPPSTAN